ncbi:MAG: LON peptidase substrate-binding domain-containing protein, partial [Paracoccaceae bacterium]|nr:LON peptidase substrate-binding domain-containing protein [Paracoccaceae bacterium]
MKFNAADLPDNIPVFPLPGAVVLPRAHLPLHIFEPRYLAMLEDILKTSHRLIGMLQPIPLSDDSALHQVGCAGRLTQFTETDDGRYMVTLTGISRFRVEREIEGFAPYLRCDVSWKGFEGDLGNAETDALFDRDTFLSLVGRYFEKAELSTDWDNLKDADDEIIINALAMMCPFEPEDKQALLECASLSERRETLAALMNFALHSDGEEM